MSINSEKPLPCKLFNPADKIPDFAIGNATRNALCFREDLIVNLKDGLKSDTKPVGDYSILLESFGPESTEFMVQVISTLAVNGSSAGSKLLSSVTAKLHCLEEKRREYQRLGDSLNEKTLFIGCEEDVYHLEGEDSCRCDKSNWQKDLALCSVGELISEGANLVLMRYLAVKNFHGSLSFQSVTIEGQLTTCSYRCLESRTMKFNDYVVDVYTIERRIHEECGLVHNSKTLMTRSGYILIHDWLEVPYLLKINSLIDPNEVDNHKHGFMAPLRSRWSSDVQMMSMYLDKKTCEVAQQSEYLIEHPEIKQLISDYTQTLLAVKPINVLSFTIQHFAAFAKVPDPSEIGGSGESSMAKHKLRPICSVCGISFDCPMTEEQKLNGQCDCTAQSSHHLPQGPKGSKFSLCSVFSTCPSDATCVRKLSGFISTTTSCSEDCKVTTACKNDGKKNNSLCSFDLECEKICKGCKINGKKDNSLCSLDPECEKTCKGCKINGKKSNSLCSFHLECEKTCEGCKINGKKDNSLCSFDPECEKTCKGCKIDGKKDNSLCSLDPDCEKTCKGCKIDGKKDNSPCSFDPECEKTCEGCRPLRKPYAVRKVDFADEEDA